MVGDRDILTNPGHLVVPTDFILDLKAEEVDMLFLLDHCCCSKGFDSAKEETYDFLYRAVFYAKKEGFGGMDIVLHIELQILNVTNEEDIITWSMWESTSGIGPASRSSIDALSMEFIANKRNLLDYASCTICMDELLTRELHHMVDELQIPPTTTNLPDPDNVGSSCQVSRTW